MMWLKSCSRCRGDLLVDADFYSRYVTCIQCGATLEESQQSIVQKPVFGKRRATKPMETEPSDEAETLVA